MTLGEHLTIAASASMFYIAIDYKNKPNIKVAASNINIKIHQRKTLNLELALELCVDHTCDNQARIQSFKKISQID